VWSAAPDKQSRRAVGRHRDRAAGAAFDRCVRRSAKVSVPRLNCGVRRRESVRNRSGAVT